MTVGAETVAGRITFGVQMRAEMVDVVIEPFPARVGDVPRLVTNCDRTASPFSSSSESEDSSDSSSSDDDDSALGGVGALGDATTGTTVVEGAQERKFGRSLVAVAVEPVVILEEVEKLTTGRLLMLLLL